MLTVISYDIKSDSRRTKIYKALKDYGDWVQYSVFECDLKEQELLKLRQRLDKLLVKEEGDSIRYYHLCAECRGKIERDGGVLPKDLSTVIVKKPRA